MSRLERYLDDVAQNSGMWAPNSRPLYIFVSAISDYIYTQRTMSCTTAVHKWAADPTKGDIDYYADDLYYDKETRILKFFND